MSLLEKCLKLSQHSIYTMVQCNTLGWPIWFSVIRCPAWLYKLLPCNIEDRSLATMFPSCYSKGNKFLLLFSYLLKIDVMPKLVNWPDFCLLYSISNR